MQQTHSFKAGDKYYEVFFAFDDNHVEVYEKDNPKEGLIFSSKKQLIAFINNITDIIEEEQNDIRWNN